MPGVLLCYLLLQAHREAPLAGLVHQSLKGAPWVGSYSVVQCVRLLMGQPLYCSVADAGVWEERGYGDGSTPHMTQQYRLASMASWLSSTGISHHSLLFHIPLIHLSTANSSPHPGIAPQSLNSRSQLLHLPGDLHPFLEYVWLQQGLSDFHSIQAATDQLFHSQP